MKLIYSLILIAFFSLDIKSQDSIRNFDISESYKIELDTILYMIEMSNYIDTSYLNRYEVEIIDFEKQDAKNAFYKDEILFIGSSSIRRWETLEKDMFPIHAINRGFGGSTMPEAIYFFNRIVIPYQPKAIVLYEGDNDITAPFLTPDVTLEMFKLFVRLTERYLPWTDIYFLSIKPSPARQRFEKKLLLTNKLIKDECNTNNKLFYIDITKRMYNENGRVRGDIFQRDRLHLNKKGYAIWTDVIKSYLLKNL